MAHCPGGGPYMQYAFQGEVDHLSFFRSLIPILESKYSKGLYITLPPEFYAEWVAPVRKSLINDWQSIPLRNLNYHLPLNQPFTTSLPTDQRRVLKQAEQAGYACSFSNDWEPIRALVSQSRLRKGFSDVISLQLLEELATDFPHHYQGIKCCLGDNLTGTGVLIRVDDRIVYLFYVANHEAHLRYSPSLQIIRFCADWAREQGFQYLDLGTAGNEGVLNEGVKSFKESIGGVKSVKYTFRIRF